MHERLEWSDTDLLRALLVFLETQSWMKRYVTGDESNSDPSLAELKAAIELISTQFRDPLEATGVHVSSLHDEIEDVVEYARNYLSLESTHYRKVWYNLYICPCASSWPNLLLLCELSSSRSLSKDRLLTVFLPMQHWTCGGAAAVQPEGSIMALESVTDQEVTNPVLQCPPSPILKSIHVQCHVPYYGYGH